MNWEVFDLSIEALKALVLVCITIFLVWAGRHRNWGQQGWKRIVAGFALLAFAAVLDLTDEFSGLERFVIIGDTEVQSFLEKVVGYSGGYLLLLSGLLSWIPTLNKLTERLTQQVGERTVELHRVQKFTEAVLEQGHDLVVACNVDGRITLSNQSSDNQLGAIPGLSLEQWAHTCPLAPVNSTTPLSLEHSPLRRALRGETIDKEEFIVQKQGADPRTLLISGRPIVDDMGIQQGAMISAYDITQRKQFEEQLRHQASHDGLTGLPNRFLLNDRLSQMINQAQRNNTRVAVMALDLDQFKAVNDNLGHAAGDQLLEQVAQRLTEAVRDSDTVARLGGDEFAVLLALAPNKDAFDPLVAARRMLKRLSQPFWLSGNEKVAIGASIGIAYYPNDGTEVATLLRNADAAMYQAKVGGRNNFVCYNTELNSSTQEQFALENALVHAFENKQFAVYYQPLLQASSGRIIGVEALLRWHHPEKGVIPAAEFISLAERSGFIVTLGEWAMRTACAQLRDWQQQGLPLQRVAVNLSERQLHQPDLVDRIRRILHETQLPARSLELELTENILIQSDELMLKLLEDLRQLGVQLAIDDFGNGYSSLAYLRQFPVSRLKLDREFVSSIPRDTVLSQAIITLAHSLRMGVVAEGVETEAQRRFLKEQGCDELQGYLLASPLPAHELEQHFQFATTTSTALNAKNHPWDSKPKPA